MKLTVQVVLHADDDTETVVREVLTVQREQPLAPDTLGLGLGEAKDLLAAVQHTLVENQVAAALSTQVGCPGCGLPHRHKDSRPIVMKTLFGRLRLDSPRWWHCGCQPQTNTTFSPLASILPERTTPELSYLQARFAGLVSYGLSADLLGELLPLGRILHANTVRLQAHATAQRLEDELGEERFSFIDTCQADLEELPRPELPLVVGLDGGYVHSASQRSRRDGWFEVIAGKAVPANGRPTCFGYVQTYDKKPKRRLFEVLKAQGMQPNQQVTFLTDGGEDIRDLPRFLNPQAEHLLDWFHITMRITVMTNMAKSLRSPPPDPDLPTSPPADLAADVTTQLESLKWFCWHGNVFRALQTVQDLQIDLDVEQPHGSQAKLLKAVREFDSYLRANAARIPNYGERRRGGEAISTAFVESTVNQVISKRMVKKQQMRWTPRGAHLLLQVRTRVLNNTLTRDYRRWYPGFTHTPEADTLNDQQVAA
ncbi:MAG: ISKra4 family transposase [Pseudonocardiaceae bacterium]